jgi:hypothetical protein
MSKEKPKLAEPEMPTEPPKITMPEPIAPSVNMTVKTISATYERKFNLGDFESASLGVSTWADIEPDQDPGAAINELVELCKVQVRKQALPILRGRKNGGFEFAELQDKYSQLAFILNDALVSLQGTHDDNYANLVERLNELTKGE